ncbi:MAG TPA: hypothetical protein PKA39_02635, partial [Ignavibacteria bacterium]|nr:hypothetical protein [Ignavibacteria bacterium]
MKFVLFVIFFALFASMHSYSQDNDHVPGEIIVMLKHGEPTSRLTNSLKFVGLKVKEPIVEYMNIWLCEFDNARADEQQVLNAVRSNNSVAIAQFNHYMSQRSPVMPNDASFGQQWALNNTGQSGGTVDADIDAPEAWGLSTSGLTAAGDTIVVAVIDGGFYLNHADLSFWKNWYEIPSNGIDDDANGFVDDYMGWDFTDRVGFPFDSTGGDYLDWDNNPNDEQG